METKEFDEIVDLFCNELEKAINLDKEKKITYPDFLNKLSEKIKWYCLNEFKMMDFERDSSLIKELTYAKHIIALQFEDELGQIQIIRRVLQSKAKEYSKEENRLHNFYLGADIGKTSPINVCFGYMLKHICSVVDILDNLHTHNLSDVTVCEKFDDLINYIILLHAVKKRSLL